MILEIPDLTIATSKARSTVYAAVKAQTFPAPDFKSGRTVGWRAETVARWLEEHGAGPTSAADLIAIRVARLEAERHDRLDAARARKAAKNANKVRPGKRQARSAKQAS